MNFIKINTLSNFQVSALWELWKQEYPKKLAYLQTADFEDYLEGLTNPNHLFLVDLNDEIKGWAVTFLRNQEIWFVIILNSMFQGKGYGSKMLNALKKQETSLSGWVIDHDNDIKQNGQPYPSPLGFYINNGFKCLSDKRIENEKISAVKIRWQQ